MENEIIEYLLNNPPATLKEIRPNLRRTTPIDLGNTLRRMRREGRIVSIHSQDENGRAEVRYSIPQG